MAQSDFRHVSYQPRVCHGRLSPYGTCCRHHCNVRLGGHVFLDERTTLCRSSCSTWRFGDVRGASLERLAWQRLPQLSRSGIISGRAHSGDPSAVTSAAHTVSVLPDDGGLCVIFAGHLRNSCILNCTQTFRKFASCDVAGIGLAFVLPHALSGHCD